MNLWKSIFMECSSHIVPHFGVGGHIYTNDVGMKIFTYSIKPENVSTLDRGYRNLPWMLL